MTMERVRMSHGSATVGPRILPCLAMLLIGALKCPSLMGQSPPVRIAVWNLATAKGYDVVVARFFSECLRDELRRSRGIEVLSGEETRSMLASQKAGPADDLQDTTSLTAVGRAVGARWIIGGVIGMEGPLPDTETVVYGKAFTCRLILNLVLVDEGKSSTSWQKSFSRFQDPKPLAAEAAPIFIQAMGVDPAALSPPVVGWTSINHGLEARATPGQVRVPSGCEISPNARSEGGLGSPWADRVIHSATEIEFVLVPPGEFKMGGMPSGKGKVCQEIPNHVVRISRPFYLAEREVTRGQFGRFLEAVGCPDLSVNAAIPVVENWLRSRSFCSWAKLRLPSEAEWEYACRGGQIGLYGFEGQAGRLDAHAWFEDNSFGMAHQGGLKRANAWGLLDMHGNVFEWCEDLWHANYRDAPTDGSPWMENGNPLLGTIRGGDYQCDAEECRSAYRESSNVLSLSKKVGFRPAMDVPEP